MPVGFLAVRGDPLYIGIIAGKNELQFLRSISAKIDPAGHFLRAGKKVQRGKFHVCRRILMDLQPDHADIPRVLRVEPSKLYRTAGQIRLSGISTVISFCCPFYRNILIRFLAVCRIMQL